MNKYAQRYFEKLGSLRGRIIGGILGGLTSGAISANSARNYDLSVGESVLPVAASVVSGAYGGQAIARDRLAHGFWKAVGMHKTPVALTALSDMYAVPTQVLLKENIKKTKLEVDKLKTPPAAPKSSFPGGTAGMVGAGVLSLAALRALYNLGSAADRISDGRAIRVSTSLRKRPNQVTDLNLGIGQLTEEQLREAQNASEGENED